jgi:uncharacterized membrane protein
MFDAPGMVAPGTNAPEIDARDAAYDHARVIALSDGVIAIAITLLGLELVPHVAGAVTGRELMRELLELAPRLVGYVLSFVVIGQFWDIHRTFFRHIHLVDSRIVWSNLLVLLWITLIPATAALLSSQVDEPAAVSLYAINLLLATMSLWFLWHYVSSAGYLRREGILEHADRFIDRYVLASLAGFGLAIPVAFVSTPVALAMVFFTATVARFVARRIVPPGHRWGR